MAEDSKVDELKFDAQAELKSVALKCKKGIYEHYKGPIYCLYSFTVHESLLIPLLHYYSFEKDIRWSRDYIAWTARVFHNGQEVPRFRFVREATKEELLKACELEAV